MCTNPEVLRDEIRTIVRSNPERIREMCSIFHGVENPEQLAELLDMNRNEMTELMLHGLRPDAPPKIQV